MDKGVKYYKKIFKGDAYMGFLAGKTAIITGAGRAVLSDGSCGSIGYGIEQLMQRKVLILLSQAEI